MSDNIHTLRNDLHMALKAYDADDGNAAEAGNTLAVAVCKALYRTDPPYPDEIEPSPMIFMTDVPRGSCYVYGRNVLANPLDFPSAELRERRPLDGKLGRDDRGLI